jgi:flagellin-like protein
MKLRELLIDDDAVSPVIGVILMVAITVILAAVIAAFVLGLGDTNSTGPQVSFDYDYDEETSPGGNGELTISVESGDTFEAGRVSFEGNSRIGSFSGNTWADSAGSSVNSGSTVSSGSRVTETDLNDDFELDIVWTSESGDDSNVLSRRTGPDA